MFFNCSHFSPQRYKKIMKYATFSAFFIQTLAYLQKNTYLCTAKTVNCQLSTVNCQLSTVNYQL